jgi:hypothetical protein
LIKRQVIVRFDPYPLNTSYSSFFESAICFVFLRSSTLPISKMISRERTAHALQ